MRYLLLTAALSLWTASVAADVPPAPAQFDSRFVQTRSLPGFSAPLTSHGVMRFDKQHGFYWEITDPYHYVFQMSSAGATETLPDGSVRQLDPAETPWLAAVQHIIVNALSGDRSDLQRYFQVVVTPLPQGERVDLTPRQGPMSEAIAGIRVTESAPG
ncbi:MAG TPA: LolA-related protein, partial [Gammaproteobacteria bacterium]|nr:LolA-related protein [Gammaproteobacteria bacterium]